MLFELIDKLKHLAGQHEQKTHAGKSRGTSIKPGIVVSDEMRAKVGKFTWDAQECCYSDTNETSDQVLDNITKRSGVPREEVNKYISVWNGGSFDNTPTETAHVVKAISDEMGVKMSNYQSDKVASETIDSAKLSTYKKITRAMYDETQEELTKRGITEVPLHRGAVLPKGTIAEAGNSVKHKLNSSESWTLDRDVAGHFTDNPYSGEDYYKHESVMFFATVPANRILSTFMTGVGTATEEEFVILGSDKSDDIMIEKYL